MLLKLDMKDLERKILLGLSNGDNSRRKRIIIMVEGIYSMEGTIVKLPEVIALKKRYHCYLYLDEAHSVGALGKEARGVTDFYGCEAHDVDILMGTFTKSFGAAGGYIAGTKQLIDHIRSKSHACFYANPMTAPIAQQILSAINIINSGEGIQNRLI